MKPVTSMRSPVTNHTCRILINAKGKRLKQPKVMLYDMMSSNMNTSKQQDGYTYLGEGECVSVYVIEDKKTVPLGGAGHFFKETSK